MSTELEERINRIESIVFELTANNEITNYLSFNPHDQCFGVRNNLGLAWIWKQFIGLQVIGLYKLFKEGEKHSFSKLLNILKANRVGNVDQVLFDAQAALKSDYDAGPYEAIRSKYLAHQDLNAPEMRLHLMEMNKLISGLLQWFNDLKTSLGLKPVADATEITSSFAEVFSCIDEYDEVKGFLLANLLQGIETVPVTAIQDIIKARGKES